MTYLIYSFLITAFLTFLILKLNSYRDCSKIILLVKIKYTKSKNKMFT
jgi:hypothetical protein